MLSLINNVVSAVTSFLSPHQPDGLIQNTVSASRFPAREGICGTIDGSALVSPVDLPYAAGFSMGGDVVFSFRGKVDGMDVHRSFSASSLQRFLENMREQVRTCGKVTSIPDLSSLEG